MEDQGKKKRRRDETSTDGTIIYKMRLAAVYAVLFALVSSASSLRFGRVERGARRAIAAMSLIAVSWLPSPHLAAAAEGYYSRAQGFYDSWNDRDVEKAISYFAENVYFVDAQYSEPFEGKENVKKYLQECADSLPGWKFIIDDYSEDMGRRKVGLKWHVSDSSKTPLPFPSRGVSFLEFNEEGLISGCTDMVEPTVKTGFFQLPLLRAVSKILGTK